MTGVIPKLLLAASILSSATPATPVSLATGSHSPHPVEGDWIGAVEIYGDLFEFRASFDREGGAWTGSTQFALGTGAKRLVSSIVVDGDEVRFEDQRIAAFRGRVDEDRSIYGTLNFGNVQADVRLVPDDSDEAKSIRRALQAAIGSGGPERLELVVRGPAYDAVDPVERDALVVAAADARSRSLAVLYGGELVGEWYAGGRPGPAGTWSITKAVVGLAVGLLIREGRIESVETPVYEFFPVWAEDDRSAVTIRHLMTHTSGLADGQPLDLYENGLGFVLDSELVGTPGETVRYNNSAFNLLAGVVEAAAGQPIDEYVGENLFRPLGIDDFTWERDNAGHPMGNTGLKIAAGDLAKVGQLMLQEGQWERRQILDREWVDRAVTPQVEGGPPIGLVWMLGIEDGDVARFHHSGALGQFLVIYPEEELVGVRQVEPFAAYDIEQHGFQSFTALLRPLAVGQD